MCIRDRYIKELGLTDINELQKVSVETFHDTFAAQNTEKNMQDYLSNSYKLETLTKEINNPNSFFYFVLNNEDDIMGYLKLNINDAQSEDDFENALEIERIYIRKNFQKQGLGKVLYNIGFCCKVFQKIYFSVKLRKRQRGQSNESF